MFTFYYVYFLQNGQDEGFIQDSHITFMTYNETAKFLEEDKDAYVKSLSEYDLYARKVSTGGEYIASITKLTMSFSAEEKQRLMQCAKAADDFFKTADFNGTDYYKLLDGKALAGTQWVFALSTKIDDKEYEEGFPHTRANIIFLSKKVLQYNETDLINTLIHEKVHIYQRFNAELFRQVLQAMNYVIISAEQVSNAKLIRANPDLDGYVYYDKSTNKEAVCLYKSERPTGINDVLYSNFISEHPYERIAYDIAGIYYKTQMHKYKDI